MQTNHDFASGPNPGLALEPNADVPSKSVAIHLISQTEMPSCSFWIGLFQAGKLGPADLLDNTSVDDIFRQAAIEGLAESKPLMLSDSSVDPARYIYLLPEGLAQSSRWVEEVTTTVKSWSPQSTGIYLAPELTTSDRMKSMLSNSLVELVKATPTSDYFLMPGAHGINAVLDISLQIKKALDEDNITVYVFH